MSAEDHVLSTTRLRRQPAAALLACLTCLACAAPAAAGHRDQLLRLAPADAGFVLVVENLRENARSFLESPFAERLRGSPIGAAVRVSPDARKLEKAEDFCRKTVGVEWSQVRDDILGDAVVFAFRPGADGRPEEGLLLLWARDEKLLAQVVDRLNDVERQSGELRRLEPQTYGGTSYVRRVEADCANCYYVHGSLFAFASREETLRAVIDAERKGTAAGETAVSRQLGRLGADGSLASVWINPRAFDREIARRAAQERVDPAVRDAVAAYWKALEGAAVVCTLGTDTIELRLGGLTRSELLPPVARQILAEGDKVTDLWGRFPPQTLLTVAGRFSPGRWDDFFDGVLTKGAGPAARDLAARNVGGGLPQLGPDWGVCVTLPPAGEKNWLPRVLAAVRAPAPERSGEASLLPAANGAVAFLVLVYNSSHNDQIEVRTVNQGDVEVRYLVNEKAFPPGLRPAYALKGGYLVAASSPEAMELFGAVPSTAEMQTPEAPPGGHAAAETPILRLSFDQLERYLRERRGEIVAFIADQTGLPKSEVAEKLTHLAEHLALFHGVEVTHRADPESFALTLRIRTAAPIRK